MALKNKNYLEKYETFYESSFIEKSYLNCNFRN